jgi:hypothetical protein
MPFWVIEKFSVAIGELGCVGWRPKKFDCHMTHLHYSMATKTFWSPRKGAMSHWFYKALDEGFFQKDATH